MKTHYSSSSLHCCQSLKLKRIIIKFPKKPKPNPKNNNNSNGFHNSHDSFWFRGLLLGKGGFGYVFMAQFNKDVFIHSPSNQLLFSGTQIAVKSYFLKDSSSLQFEKKVLHHFNSCSNVVKCYGHEITKSISGKQTYNLLLEYSSDGSLYDRISKFGPNGLPEWEVRPYMRDIVCGLAFIHGRRYIHCDIKPENILLMSSLDHGGCLVAKIADFGLAMEMTDVVMIDEDGIRGTPSYIALESWRDSHIDWPVDIWAVGCVVLEMLTGKQVWNSKSFDLDMLSDIGDSNKLPITLTSLSPMAIDFLRKCLVRNPYKRSSAWMLLDHPFIYDFS